MAVLAATVTLGITVPGTAVAAEPTPPPPPVQVLTEDTTAVARPDGGREVTLFAGPVQLRRGAEWVPVDLTLAVGPDGVVRPAAAPHDLSLTPTGPVVRYSQGGGAALAPVTTGPLPAPVLAGHRATYEQVAPGYDLVVEATRAGFLAAIRRAGTPTGPAPRLALTPAPGPAAATGPATGPVPGSATESVPGSVPGSVPAAGSGPAPAADPAAVAAADALAAAAGTASAVSRVVAAAPAAGPAPAPFDTTVQTTIRNTDASGDPDLRLGSYDGVAVARSYLAFDLAELAGRPVGAARLRVHQDWSSSCEPAAWQVWSSPAAGPATRWTGQPAAERLWATSTETRGHSPACAAGWTEVDVTELVRSWVAAGVPNGTVQLRAADETDPRGWKRLGSAESMTVPSLVVSG